MNLWIISFEMLFIAMFIPLSMECNRTLFKKQLLWLRVLPPDLSEDTFLTVCLHPPALAFWHSSVLWGTHLHSPLTIDCSLRSTLWLLDCLLRPAWVWCKNSIVKELCFPLPLTASSFSTFLLVFLPSQHHHSMMIIKLLIRNI